MGVLTRAEVDAIIERVRSWPEEKREEAALILLALEEQDGQPYELSEEEERDLDEALEEEARGEFATEEEVEAFFKRHR